MTGKKRWLVVGVFVLFCVGLSLSGIPVWFSRAIIILVAFLVVSAVLCWVGLNPRSKLFRKDAKLNKSRHRIQMGIRAGLVIAGLGIFFFMTVPFARDMLDIIGRGKPFVITGRVEHWARPTPWSIETVSLSLPDSTYHLAFFTQRFQVGATYQFVVLPRSRFVLRARRLSATARAGRD